MAWYVTLDDVQEVNQRCVVDATVEEKDDGNVLSSWPYHVEYDDVEDMSLNQVKADVTNFAQERASEGAAIDTLKTYKGQTFELTW